MRLCVHVPHNGRLPLFSSVVRTRDVIRVPRDVPPRRTSNLHQLTCTNLHPARNVPPTPRVRGIRSRTVGRRATAARPPRAPPARRAGAVARAAARSGCAPAGPRVSPVAGRCARVSMSPVRSYARRLGLCALAPGSRSFSTSPKPIHSPIMRSVRPRLGIRRHRAPRHIHAGTKVKMGKSGGGSHGTRESSALGSRLCDKGERSE